MTQDELDRIEARVQAWRTAHQIDSVECMAASADDVPALVAEVKRLRDVVTHQRDTIVNWHRAVERTWFDATSTFRISIMAADDEWAKSEAKHSVDAARALMEREP